MPLVIVTAPVLVVQPDSWPVTVDGSVPPPEFLSRGEKFTMADRAQLTDPGAAPLNVGDFAEAGVATPETNPADTIIAPTNTNQRRIATRIQGDRRYVGSALFLGRRKT
jgi:hypothetical protein